MKPSTFVEFVISYSTEGTIGIMEKNKWQGTDSNGLNGHTALDRNESPLLDYSIS